MAQNDAPDSETPDALAGFGLVLDGPAPRADDVFWLWPENAPGFQLWQGVQTQWVVGMAGATGLSYPGVEVFLRHQGLRRKEQQQHFAEMQIMERAALAAWDEKRKKP